jgi:hypothetical protein
MMQTLMINDYYKAYLNPEIQGDVGIPAFAGVTGNYLNDC